MVLGKAVDSLLSGGPQQYFVDDQAPWPGEDEGDDLGHVVGGDLGLVVELLDAFPGRCAPSAVHGPPRTGRAGGVSWLDARHRVERASPCAPARRPGHLPGRCGQGRAVALMTGAVRETMTLAGRAERARVARAFVDGVLGPGHPCGDVATLLVDELFVNSIRHSGSAARGETVTVAVKTANDVIRVEVTDLSGPGVPQLRPSGGEAEDG
jgi:hypothetical protein